jgi:hypothetical protein
MTARRLKSYQLPQAEVAVIGQLILISKVSVVVVCFFPKNPDQVAINALPLTDSTR